MCRLARPEPKREQEREAVAVWGERAAEAYAMLVNSDDNALNVVLAS